MLFASSMNRQHGPTIRLLSSEMNIPQTAQSPWSRASGTPELRSPFPPHTWARILTSYDPLFNDTLNEWPTNLQMFSTHSHRWLTNNDNHSQRHPVYLCIYLITIICDTNLWWRWSVEFRPCIRNSESSRRTRTRCPDPVTSRCTMTSAMTSSLLRSLIETAGSHRRVVFPQWTRTATR